MLNSSSDQVTRLSATFHSQLPMCATRCASARRVPAGRQLDLGLLAAGDVDARSDDVGDDVVLIAQRRERGVDAHQASVAHRSDPGLDAAPSRHARGLDRVGDAHPLGRGVREPGQIDEAVAHDLIAPQRARRQRRLVHIDDDAADGEQPDDSEDRIDHAPQPALVGDDQIVTSGLQQRARLPERTGAHVLRVGDRFRMPPTPGWPSPSVLDESIPGKQNRPVSPSHLPAQETMARVRDTVNRIAIALTCGGMPSIRMATTARRRRRRGDLPALRHGCRDVVRGRRRPTPRRWPPASRRCSRERRGSCARTRTARRSAMRTRRAIASARRTSGRSTSRCTSTPATTAAGRPRALREAVRAVAATGLLRRARRHHAAERGQRRPARVARLRTGRRLPGGGLEIRRLARRRVVAASAAGSGRDARAAPVRRGSPGPAGLERAAAADALIGAPGGLFSYATPRRSRCWDPGRLRPGAACAGNGRSRAGRRRASP